MARAIDAARYLLKLAAAESAPDEPEWISPLRLQKLLYYVQGWTLAVRRDPMFPEVIEAWAHGPVVDAVHQRFRGYADAAIPETEAGDPRELDDGDKAIIRSVWEHYKQFSALALRRKTRCERPWLEARGDLPADAPCRREISQETMALFFREQLRRHAAPGMEPERIESAERAFREGRGIPLRNVLDELGHVV